MMNINKPTFLVDKPIAVANIRRMKHKAENSHVTIRPHFKTHQSAEVGNWFKAEGIEKITVSSVEMANYFAEHGWKDITIAFPLNIRELDSIKQLSEKIELTVLVSSMNHMEALLTANIKKLNYFIKIDVGYHRSGLEPNQFSIIEEIVAKRNERLIFKGLLSHLVILIMLTIHPK
jgi:D-serine deaminase-like pyridoxal phosphate-dependent protein